MTQTDHPLIRRIERKLNFIGLKRKLVDALSPSDLSSLLIEVFAARAENLSPASLLQDYKANAYAQPGVQDAAIYRRLEAEMLEAASALGVTCLQLSPAAVFGSASAFGAVSQNKIISATRNLEILSDATNMLSLYAAASIEEGALSHDPHLQHLCTTQRHVRYQANLRPNQFTHFGLFTMVSAGKAKSSYGFEKEALLFHLRFYRDFCRMRHGKLPHLLLNRRKGYKDTDGLIEHIQSAIAESFPDLGLSVDERENQTAYYQGLRLVMLVDHQGTPLEMGDMGFTDWTQKLLGRKSERLLISSFALDRQLMLSQGS